MASSSLNTLSTTNNTVVEDELSLPDKIQTIDEYKRLYALSIEDPNQFWKMAAKRLNWYCFPTKIKNTEFDYRTERSVDIKWYEDGILNACYNCLDRHIEKDPSIEGQTAIIFEPDTITETQRHISYGELLVRVKKFANVLKRHGIKKGHRVTVYMPMVVETCIAILACARIGAIHSVVFGGFSPNSIAERISNCNSTLIITSDFGVRGGKHILLKSKVDQALTMEQCNIVKSVLVFQRNYGMKDLKDDFTEERRSLKWIKERDFWVHEELDKVDEHCEPEQMNAEDPLFIVSSKCNSIRCRRFSRTVERQDLKLWGLDNCSKKYYRLEVLQCNSL